MSTLSEGFHAESEVEEAEEEDIECLKAEEDSAEAREVTGLTGVALK